MKKYEFFEGQELNEVWWNGENTMFDNLLVGQSTGSRTVVKIKVSMECGQMAEVAWAVVFFDNGSCIKCNLALATGVQLSLKAEDKDNE